MLLDQLRQFALLSEHREKSADEFVVIMRSSTIVDLKDSHDSYNSSKVKCAIILSVNYRLIT